MRVLLVEDDAIEAAKLRSLLLGPGGGATAVTVVDRITAARTAIWHAAFDVVLVRARKKAPVGPLLHRLRKTLPALPGVVLSSADDEAMALEALRAGAEEVVGAASLGTPRDGSLARALRSAIERHRLTVRVLAAATGPAGFAPGAEA